MMSTASGTAVSACSGFKLMRWPTPLALRLPVVADSDVPVAPAARAELEVYNAYSMSIYTLQYCYYHSPAK